ncbi:MAG TPA: hypothetical protein VJ160_02410 [Anaerolineales bacterium]|nr:hypothetical protein [Anaerolineales bacterium]
MRRGATATRALVVMVGASLACGLPAAGGAPPRTASPSDASTEASGIPTPTATSSPPGEWVEIEPPPPAGILDALQMAVESGEMTYEESLVTGLQILAGEVEAQSVFAELPTSMEGTGVLFDAQRYLQTGADSATKGEIERLLRILAPLPDVLLPYSSPEGMSRRLGGGLLRPRYAEQDCAQLYAEGFPAGSTAQCFLYKEATVGSSKIQVFYPITTLPSGFTTAYADAAMQAVVDSIKQYAALSLPGKGTVLKNVQVVFTLLESKGADAFAVVPTDPGQEPCQVILYPLAISNNENKKGGVPSTPGGPPPAYALFQQTVAHEMFHCFQVWNFPALSANATWGVNDWWGESTATYFSNVVYPATNEEWRWLNTWGYNSGKTSLAYRSYDNFGFFQYLGNKIGNNGILSLIQSLGAAAAGDEAAQEAQLAKFPNIQVLFDNYARDYMDGKIADTSKALFPTAPAFVLPEYRLDVLQAETLHLGAPPFTLMRYGLTFGSGNEYKLAPTITGGGGLDTSRPRDVVGAWADLPPTIKASCAFTKHYFLMTSTLAPGDLFNIDLGVTLGDPVGCDQCLIGTWDINLDSFAAYSEAPFEEMPGFYQFDAAGGLWRYRFRADGTMRGEFDFFYTYSLLQAGGEFGADITTNGKIDIDGTGEGTYLSDGLSNLTFSLVKDSVSLTDEIYINGQKLDASVFGSVSGGYGFASGDTTVYSCDAEAGELLISVAPQANLPPIQYDRVSTDPTKP